MEKTTIIEETSDRRFALLIDADNVSARYLRPILKELSKYGTVTIKRIYGDWTLTLHAKWKDALLENSITPIQQFGYTQGKNATDSAMIIDAMDILYTDNVDGFCLVSSDSDFTRLASRLRESGRMVIGMGEKKTPIPFRRACDVFTTLELLVQKKNERGASEGGTSAVPKDSVEQAVVDIITDNQNNGKATGLGEIGSRLQKRYPDFDVRNYGTNLLSKLLEEFTRVRITKDHSSVTVELTEGVEEKGSAEKAAEPKETKEAKEAAEAPEAKRGRGSKRAKAAEAEVAADEPPFAEEAPAEMENTDKQEKPGRRSRSHRVSRRVSTKGGAPAEDAQAEASEAAGTEATGDAAETPAEADGAPKDMKPGRRARADRKAKADQKTESSPTEDRPKKKTRKTSAKSAPTEESAAESAEAAEAAESARSKKVAKEAPAKKAPAKTAPAKQAPAKKASAKEAPAKKAPAKRKSAKKAAADTPAGYILQLVTDAGAEGIMLSAITDRLREKFKDFKVRDLGYSQMRQYMESTGQYALEKSGRNFRVRLV